MPLEGNLRDFSLANIIQLNCSEQNTAKVTLDRRGKEGVIFFDGGSIKHAALGSLAGEEAVYELLRWRDANFRVESGVTTKEETVNTNWNALLLEGMRRIDEGEASMADQMNERAEALRALPGVEGVVLISRDGVVLAESIEGNAEREGAVAVFVGNAADQIGEVLSLTPFDWGVVTMTRDRVLVLGRAQFCAGLLLTEKTSPAMVSSEVAKVLAP